MNASAAGGTPGLRRALLRRLIKSETLARAFGEGPPDIGSVTLDKHKIFILPTGHGLVLGSILLVMLIGSVNYNNNLGLSFTFLIGASILVSILYTYRNLAGLGFRPGRVEPVFAGQAAAFTLCIDNSAGEARYGISLRCSGDYQTALDLAANDHHCAVLERQTEQRGRLALGRVAVETRYPLGLFRAWSWLDPAIDTLVYPRPSSQQELPTTEHGAGRGERPHGLGNEDFLGLRGYRAGDASRQVHWKSIARGQPPQTKLFSGIAGGELWLDWADLASPASVEQRLSQLCRWVLEADASGCRYGLALPGQRLEPQLGPRHRARCLEALALFRPGLD